MSSQLGNHKIELNDVKDARISRHLQTEMFTDMYTEEEFLNITKNLRGTYESLSETKFAEELEKQKIVSHTWTLAEDDFIKKNYLHLSDNTIGLALNVPARMVKYRRNCLGLTKGTVKNLNKVIVWAKRDDFQEVCSKYELTKLRGDGVLI